LADFLTFLRTPSYVFNTLGMTMMTFALGGLAFWMPRYMYQYRKAGDLGEVNLIFGALTIVSGITATLLGGYIGDKLRSRYSGSYFLVSGIGMLVGLPFFAAVLFTKSNAVAWGLIFVAEFCVFFNTGPSNTILANVVHPAVRASAFALNIFIIHAFGDAISPPLIGWVTDRTGDMNVGFGATVALAIFLSGVFWLMGAKHLKRDTELAPTRLAE
jgi:MFS family permease